jgi:hypothetical protein
MRRRLRLQLRAGKAVYNEACRKAGEAFGESRYRDALTIYEQFAKEHPDTHTEEIQLRTRALKSYIEDYVEKLQGASPPSTSS